MLHEPLIIGGMLYSKARNVPRNRNLFAINYMVKHSIKVDVCQHNNDKILKAITKPFSPFFLNISDVINNYSKYNHYDVLFSISEADGIAPELFRRIIRSKTPHVTITFGLTNLLTSRKVRSIKNLLKHLYHEVLRDVSLMLFHSRPQMLFLENLLNLSSHRMRFLPLGVDTDFFKPCNEFGKYVLSVGRDSGRDYGTLIKAVKNVNESLRIISGRTNLMNLVIPKNVRAEIEITHESLRDRYSEAKFIVIPVRNYHSVSGQMALLESFAMGKAVIATKCWGTEDYIVDGKTGFLVEPGNEIELKEKILYLLNNPEIAESVGKNARKFVESKCNLEIYSKNVLASLKEACKTRAFAID